MERGNELEAFARDAYMTETGTTLGEVGLGFLDDNLRISASPDGLTGLTNLGGVEIKCPNPKAHMATIQAMSAPKAYLPQCNGNMWVFGCESWDLVSFCPEFEARPLVIIRVKRDEEMIKKISESAHRGVQEIDAMIKIAEDYQYTNPDELQSITNGALAHMEMIYIGTDVDFEGVEVE
jgi:hypothetical protein